MAIIVVTTAIGFAAAALAWIAAHHFHARLIAPRLASATVADQSRPHGALGALAQSRLDPATETGLALTVGVGLLVAGALAVGALLFMVRDNVGFAQFDLTAARFGADHATAASTQFLRIVSQMGGAVFLVPATVVVAIVASLRQRRIAVVGFLALAVGGQFAVANVIKLLVHRARPTIGQLTGFNGSSFPSGHATAAAASLAAFALILGRDHPSRVATRFAAAAVGLAVAVACTRVFLGVHWLTDVLAGLALGWTWFALSSLAFGGRLLQFGAPVEQLQAAAEAAPSGTAHQ